MSAGVDARDMMGPVAGHTSETLIGRDAELGEIAAMLGLRPEPGRTPSCAVLLSGDAGVGKTRLLTELRDLAVEQGWQVFAGHCLDFGDSALPYLPFSEVLGRLGTDLPDVVSTVAGIHPALSRLQPGRRVLGSQEAGDGAALDRSDLFEAVHGLLDAAAEKAPVLLVIEDAHWADQSTRDMLSFLFSRPFVGPVKVVASYRSDDLHRRHPLRNQVAEWSRIRDVERLQLQPLAAPDVRSLIHELHPDPMDEADVADIVDRAEGNAFFVEELVGAASGPGRWVPAELADVLLVRLDRLDDQARQVVRAASVAGRRVSHDMLSEASALDPDCLDEGLRKAVEMNILLSHGQRYVFRHALLGEAVYDDLLPGERVRLHKAYAEALSQGRARGTAAELARHARLAMDLPTALGASIRAGDEAIAVGGPDEAAHHYQQALELLADPRRAEESDVEITRLAVKAAEALTASGHPIRAAALLKEQLDLLPDDAPPAGRARLLSARANCLVLIETNEDRIAVSEQAVALVPDEDTGLRAKILVTHARVLASMARYEEAQVVGVDALELAERLDLNELASDAITTLSQLKKAGPKEGLRAALMEAVARAQKSGALEAELRGRWLLGRSYQDWAEFDETETWFISAIERGEAAGIPWAPYAFESRWQLAIVAVTRGEWDRALELTDVPGQAPPVPRALLDSVRYGVLVGRGVDVAAGLGTCGSTGARKVASPSPRRARDGGGRSPQRRGRRAPGLRRSSGRSAGSGTPGSRPGSGWPPRRSGPSPPYRPCPPPSGRRTSRPPSGSTATGTPSSSGTPTRRASGVPRAGPGSSGSTPSCSGCAGWRGGRAAGRRTRRHLARDGRDVRGLRRRARDRPVPGGARRHPARHRRPGRRPRGGRCGASDGAPARGPAVARRAQGARLHRRPQRGRLRHAHPAGAGDPGAGRRGQVERRDRQAAVHQRQDRQRPRVQHPRQARRRRPHRGRRDRPATRAAGLRPALRPARPAVTPAVRGR